MPEKRDYPPAVIVHRPDCPDIVGRRLARQATAVIAHQHPNGKPHRCYHFHQNSVGVVEVVEYAAHAYEESTIDYPDATRRMCGFCGGTHGVLDALVLPPGARTVAPPRQT